MAASIQKNLNTLLFAFPLTIVDWYQGKEDERIQKKIVKWKKTMVVYPLFGLKESREKFEENSKLQVNQIMQDDFI